MTSGVLREVRAPRTRYAAREQAAVGLTVLGVVIGITAIVGMTSLIRGFDQSLRDSIRELGPNTIFVAKFSGVSLAGRAVRRTAAASNLTVDDATAIEKLARRRGLVDIWLGAGGPPTQTRVVLPR
jgi:ABC-type lipoprotein release transport system permease subunit